MSARQVASESSEEEYFSVGPNAYAGADTSDSEADTASMAPPRHPVPSMQGAFEESIYESSEPNPQPKPKDGTAETRRQQVLEARNYDDAWTTRWKQKPSARHHPLAKLMAQIVFGMHLLQQQAAKSDEEVVKILQTHVDEVDNFLEKTTDDFDLAIKDIAERIHFLKLPMSHPDVFGKMLEDKQFRSQLMEGNEKIDNIIERTSRAMNAALLDMQKGKAATKELGHYLNAVADDWPGEKQDLEAVLTAMRGNEQGWKHCYKDLQTKSFELRDDLDQLSSVIREMARMAAEASRRVRAHGKVVSAGHSPMSAIPRSKFSSDKQRARAPSVDKPLPKAPIPTGAVELEAHPVPMERRYEQPRDTPASPSRSGKGQRSSTVPPRPSTSNSMRPREARDPARNSTHDIVDFLQEGREPSALTSNPTDKSAKRPKAGDNPNRQSAIDVVEHARRLSTADGRPSTADGTTVLSHPRRGSEPLRMNGHRVGIERNKDGPPPSGRRESSIGPRFMRRLSFRSSKQDKDSDKKDRSPPPSRAPSRGGTTSRAASPPLPPSRPAAARRTTATDRTSSPPDNLTLKPIATNSSTTHRAASPRPNTHLQSTQPQTQPQPSEPPSTPSAASARSTTASPSLATTPGTESNLSPAARVASSSLEKPMSPRPKLANGIGGGSSRSISGVGSKTSVSAQPPEEKTRSRGFSLKRFFASKMPKERVPRGAMTYGDLA